jgi:methyltransferase (TIGR00027 family)
LTGNGVLRILRSVPASRTARYVALYRALEDLERRRPRLFSDPLARRFLPASYRALLIAARLPALHRAISRYADTRAPGARSSAIARTRSIDDVVRSRAVEGVRQFVLLGAGFDCRAHRLIELAGAAVFEVDRPDTQAVKRSRLGSAHPRTDVRYVPVDFLRDDVAAALAGAGWDASDPCVCVWEGVTNYLSEDAVAGVMGWVGRAAAGSTLVFTYVHAGLLDGSARFEDGDRILENVRALAEPWTFGLDPGELRAYLARFRLDLVEDLGADDYRRRYLPGWEPDGGYAFYRLAVATPARPAPA